MDGDVPICVNNNDNNNSNNNSSSNNKKMIIIVITIIVVAIITICILMYLPTSSVYPRTQLLASNHHYHKYITDRIVRHTSIMLITLKSYLQQ